MSYKETNTLFLVGFSNSISDDELKSYLGRYCTKSAVRNDKFGSYIYDY